MNSRIDVCLICNAKYHDSDFVRLELLKLLHDVSDIRVRVFEDYSCIDAIKNCDALLTYTCDILPDAKGVDVLSEHLASGKRWFALHATNSIIEFLEDGRVDSPKDQSGFMALMGSQFIAHPPIQTFKVEPTDQAHPLTEGIDAFSVSDELYLSEVLGNIQPLLVTHYSGKAQEGFVQEDWPSTEPRSVMYLYRPDKQSSADKSKQGEVLYLTLGHARSTYDMQPLMDEYPEIERCAWETPQYYELLKRGISWLIKVI
ncbi:MAG: ThuA domain-containing protein [Pseudomonadales bacterium]|nr:ThuA domain-containing protein [Pseudomonadales bacterium]